MQYLLSEKEYKEYNEFKKLKEKPIAFTYRAYESDNTYHYRHLKWMMETEATQFLKDEIKKIEQSRDRLSQMVKDLEKENKGLKTKKEAPAKSSFARWMSKIYLILSFIFCGTAIALMGIS